jgi:hypothetical protein
MRQANWYTDAADITRVTNDSSSAYAEQVRSTVATDVPCRAYNNAKQNLKPHDTSYVLNRINSLAFPLGTDVCTGDEITLTRGIGVGKPQAPVRYLAGSVTSFVEPFGGVFPALEHIEVQVFAEEIIDLGEGT